MKKLILFLIACLLFLIAGALFLTSCISPLTPDSVRTYTVKKGEHTFREKGFDFPMWGTIHTVTGYAWFDEKSTMPIARNIGQWNKLVLLKHRGSKERESGIGWRPIDNGATDSLELSHYYRLEWENWNAVIFDTIHWSEKVHFAVRHESGEWRTFLHTDDGGLSSTVPSGISSEKAFMVIGEPYYGGREPAPVSMTIRIRYLNVR